MTMKDSKSGGLEAQMKVHPILEQRREKSAIINRVQPIATPEATRTAVATVSLNIAVKP
jgi:hypothetical protein